MNDADVSVAANQRRPSTRGQVTAPDAPAGPEERRAETLYGALGLTGAPFAVAPDETGRGMWIALPSRESVLHELVSWLTDPEFPSLNDGGLAVVTGDAGSGRTSLLLALAASLRDRPDLLVATVGDEGNRRSDALLLRAMIAALGATPAGRTGRDLIAEVRALVSAHLAAGRRPVILIDNAALSGSQLEIVRMLLAPMNDEAPVPGARLGARLVLFGPPEVTDRIRRRRALAGMVEITQFLAPLDEAEIGWMIGGRIEAMLPDAAPDALLDATGGDDAVPLFTAEAIAIISAWSGGNPGEGIRMAGACLREAIARGRAEVDRAVAQGVASALTDEAGLFAPMPPPTMEPVVQTRLDLNFGDLADDGRERAGSGHSTRTRRRR